MLYFDNELSLIWRGFWNFEFEKMVVTDLTGLLMGDDIKTGSLLITELHYVGWAKIKTIGHRRQTRTDVITHWYMRMSIAAWTFKTQIG